MLWWLPSASLTLIGIIAINLVWFIPSLRDVRVPAAAFVGLGILVILIRSQVRLHRFNAKLNDLLHENYEVGKILVRRDIELSDVNSRLEALDRSKSEFVSVAAHQLRTPITGIRWTFNALLDNELGKLTAEQLRIAEDGLKSAIRMIELINDLLNVARIEEGRFGLHFKRQPLLPLIQAAIEHYKQIAEPKGVSIVVDLPTNPIPDLNLDEEKFHIAIDNLLDNAIKYTPPGGTITVRVAQENNIIAFSVKDTGIGVPRSQIPRLFNKFFRAENAQRFQTSGSGLGLYVVKNITEAHGGTIAVESEEGTGTMFTIKLPIPATPGTAP